MAKAAKTGLEITTELAYTAEADLIIEATPEKQQHKKELLGRKSGRGFYKYDDKK